MYQHVVVKTIHNPSDEILFDRSGIAILRCPICGDTYSHAQAVYTLLGGGESAGLYRGSHLVARETPEDRDAIAVRVYGETCGHRWDVVFQQHEGQTFVRLDVLQDGPACCGSRERMR